MPAIAVPKTRIITGPGFLYRAPIGSLLPGQTSATVSNKALTSNVVTLTTSTAHGFTTGDKIIVSISDAVFDGIYTVASAPTTTTLTYARSSANVSSVASSGTILSWKAGGTVANSVFTDSWPSAWTPIGATKEGMEFKWAPKLADVKVAEFLLPVKKVTESIDGGISFEVAEMTARNFAWALNGATVDTISGSGATLLSEVNPPDPGTEVRTMVGWESEASDERLFGMQCFQGGEMSEAHKQGADNATMKLDWSFEYPAFGKPFRRFYAGSTAVGV